ncbi:hypothetical protein V6N13_048653 [Hibiscus sabdariffa]
MDRSEIAFGWDLSLRAPNRRSIVKSPSRWLREEESNFLHGSNQVNARSLGLGSLTHVISSSDGAQNMVLNGNSTSIPSSTRPILGGTSVGIDGRQITIPNSRIVNPLSESFFGS